MKILSIIGYNIQFVMVVTSIYFLPLNQTIAIGLMFLFIFVAFVQQQIEIYYEGT